MKKRIERILKRLPDMSFDIDSAIKEVDKLRNHYHLQKDVTNANVLWALLSILKIHSDYRKMFSQLQVGCFYDAWCMMEQLDNSITTLLRNFPGTVNAVIFVQAMVSQLQSLYPYKVFLSTVMVIHSRICSICGKKRMIRSHCGHIPGYVYDGELCYDIVEKCDLKGVDLVCNPEHKYAVAFLTDENGNKKEYSYLLLEGLMERWKNPYSPWHYTTNHIHKSPKEFPGLIDESLCPCGSGKSYGECCKSDPEGVKHVIYSFVLGGGKNDKQDSINN